MARIGRTFGLLGVVVLAGCGSPSGQPELALTASPAHASMFGDVDVALTGDFSAVGEVQAIHVRGVRALALRPVPGGMVVRIQGAPSTGPAEIVITGSRETRTNSTAFAYDPPAGGAPVRWAAFGASLTHGFQSGGLDARAQTMSYAAQVARAAGVSLNLALVVDGALPLTQPAAFVGNCDATMDVGRSSNALFSAVSAPGTEVDLRRVRRDAELRTRNLAIGGSTVRDVLEGASGLPRLLERIEALPDGDPIGLDSSEVPRQLDRLVAMDADVVFSGDLLANDLVPAIVGNDVDVSLSTEPDVLAAQLVRLADALGALHGQYFIGTLFDATQLPSIPVLRAKRMAARKDTPESFDAKVARVRARIDAYNRALRAALAPHPNLHVVDLVRDVSDVVRDGTVIDGEHLTAGRFGGLLSLDHLHFSDTGYAVYGNAFIREMNRVLRTTIPEIDLSAVHRNDPSSSAHLRAAGVQCSH